MSCIFCDIINGNLNAEILFKNSLITVVLDSDPINDGHILIMPNKHKKDLEELDESEIIEIGKMSKEFVKILKHVFNPDGYSIMQNGGIFNDIGHYHYHIFPRNKDDKFGWKYGDSKKEDIKEIKKRYLGVINNRLG